MELLLTIRGGDTAEQEAYSHRFDESGGTIGRSPRNDWMLIDPDRFVSERHARVEFHDGRFLLTDLSTNGTYLNDSRRRIAKHDTIVLESGDRLTMGNLSIDVSVLGARGRHRGRAEEEEPPRRARRGSTIPQRQGSPGRRQADDRTATRAGNDQDTPPIPDEWRDLLAGFFEPGTERETTGDRSPARRSDRPTDREIALKAMLRELGVEDLSGEIQAEAFGQEVGRILRMVADGLMEALKTRAEIKNKFRIEQTQMRAAGNNPLKASANLETALHRLFADRDEDAYLRGAPAFREAFDDLRTHELAILSAVHASIEAVIANFDPRPLKKKLRRIAPVSAATPVLSNAKAWSLYEDYYQEVAATLRDDARLGFLKEFAKAYEAATEDLRAASDRERRDD